MKGKIFVKCSNCQHWVSEAGKIGICEVKLKGNETKTEKLDKMTVMWAHEKCEKFRSHRIEKEDLPLEGTYLEDQY